MKQNSKNRGLKLAALIAAASALAGCYYEPGYYTRGDAYYGTGDYYYDGDAYYAPGYYAPGYYGGYWPGYYYGPSIGGPSIGIGYYYDYRHRGWRDHDRIGRGNHAGGWPPAGYDGPRIPSQMPGARSSPARGAVPSAPSRPVGASAPSRGSAPSSHGSPSRGSVGRGARTP